MSTHRIHASREKKPQSHDARRTHSVTHLFSFERDPPNQVFASCAGRVAIARRRTSRLAGTLRPATKLAMHLDIRGHSSCASSGSLSRDTRYPAASEVSSAEILPLCAFAGPPPPATRPPSTRPLVRLLSPMPCVVAVVRLYYLVWPGRLLRFELRLKRSVASGT